MNIYERIQQLRKSHNLSQEQLAERLGVSRQAVSKWESRQSLPDIDKIIAISEYFSVSCDWLLTGKETNTPSAGTQKIISKQRVMLTASCMNIAGFVAMVVLWREWQNMHAIAIGFVFILASFFIMGMGATFMDQPDRDTAVYQWLKKIIWLDALLPTAFVFIAVLPVIYNIKYFHWPLGVAVLAIVYAFICIATILIANRKIKNKNI